jgi:hypothetical protein
VGDCTDIFGELNDSDYEPATDIRILTDEPRS